MFDPIHLGMDENGKHVYVELAERNMLLGGEPGAGKSSGINLIVAHGALSYECKLILVDGKRVERPWRQCADCSSAHPSRPPPRRSSPSKPAWRTGTTSCSLPVLIKHRQRRPKTVQ